MKRIVNKKLLLIIISLATFFFILSSNFFKSKSLDIVYPVQKGISLINNTLSYIYHFFYEKDFTYHKLKNLEEENQKLKAEILKYKNQISEIEKIYPILDFIKKYQIQNYEIAKVIGISSDNWSDFFFIDKGRKNGIKIGDLVLKDGFLIGVVKNVGDFSSEVLTVSDENFKITVRTRKTQEISFFQGLEKNKGILKYVRPEQDIRIGDIVETTVINSEAAEGVPIGIIRKISPKEGEFFREVEVETFYYPYNLDIVLVVKR
ncbi:MAG TPA: rod shape-determining protein MreC [Sulfurihydrogenibium sp.]|uniref:rod shape-determining protein MreC n=1 Tax=Sulfurihydrogenibium sp. (strain YO3AOP1) TaxID=436114 RepID=UPI0001724136|nr:rod shape-determining protein MreC [Sulfurihydrogenibium sp. YO3AOP1]ACD65752.1 Rod shape-determining protein MreC [Sulfurihydrogenibium sp. YO3AOP1]HBT97896.1 rod shape-determining protein MreC [Sulfurihydrogenibium sp.]